MGAVSKGWMRGLHMVTQQGTAWGGDGSRRGGGDGGGQVGAVSKVGCMAGATELGGDSGRGRRVTGAGR